MMHQQDLFIISFILFIYLLILYFRLASSQKNSFSLIHMKGIANFKYKKSATLCQANFPNTTK